MAQHIHGLGLGRWAHLDPENRDYETPIRTLAARKSVQWDADDQPVLNQGDVGGCTGFTVADVLNTPLFAHSRKRGMRRDGYLGDADGLQFYSDATRLDGFQGVYPPNDTGSTGTSAAKGAQKRGFWGAFGHTFSFEAFLANLQRQPVMMGTLWTESMSDPTSEGLVKVQGDPVGGHEWAAMRLDWSLERICGLNHWTSEWGVNGRFWVSFADMEWLINQQGDVVVPHPV